MVAHLRFYHHHCCVLWEGAGRNPALLHPTWGTLWTSSALHLCVPGPSRTPQNWSFGPHLCLPQGLCAQRCCWADHHCPQKHQYGSVTSTPNEVLKILSHVKFYYHWIFQAHSCHVTVAKKTNLYNDQHVCQNIDNSLKKSIHSHGHFILYTLLLMITAKWDKLLVPILFMHELCSTSSDKLTSLSKLWKSYCTSKQNLCSEKKSVDMDYTGKNYQQGRITSSTKQRWMIKLLFFQCFIFFIFPVHS